MFQSDSAGEATIASRYTQWYSDVLLRRVSAGHICFSNTLRSFVSLTAEGAIPFNAEEFTDPSELRALAELLGKLLISGRWRMESNSPVLCRTLRDQASQRDPDVAHPEPGDGAQEAGPAQQRDPDRPEDQL